MDKKEEVWKHIPLIDLLQILKFETDNLNSKSKFHMLIATGCDTVKTTH
jgi:hypothetical protein